MKSLVQKVNDVLEQVSGLKGSAQTNRDFEDYPDALQDLDDAILCLDSALRELEGKDPGEVEHFETLRLKLAREIADCYGMKGGIYRRQEKLEDAEAMYGEGGKYEHDYNIPDTYNRTNVIVLRLLRHPKDHEALGAIIRASRDIVQDQVKGKNKNKWWAWADFGLLSLLSVNLKGTEHPALYRKEAHYAYEQFKKNGAGMQHFESTIDVLKQLKQGFMKADEATALLIQEEIDYLKANMP